MGKDPVPVWIEGACGRMKLAFCLFKYFPYSGLSRDLFRIVQECNRRGHDLEVYVSEWQGKQPKDISIHVLRVLSLSNHAQNVSFYKQFREKTAGQKFDAVIGFNKMPGLDLYYGADYCYIARAVPRYSPLYRLSPRYHALYSFERAVFDVHSATTILSLSEREKGVYQQHYRTPEYRFELLPPTLDSDRQLSKPVDLVRKETRLQLGVKDEEFVLLFVGSGFKTKGLDRAIKAFAALPKAIRAKTRLYIVGQDKEQLVQRLISQYGLTDQLYFLGGRNDILELMTAGDLLIHPAYNETTGTVLIEAVSVGLPVLTTDVCGYAPHITRADAGLVLRSPFEQKELNQKLLFMLNADEKSRWKENGLKYGKNPELYRMPQTVADIIERQVAEKKTRREAYKIQVQNDADVYIRKDLRNSFNYATAFDNIMAISGEEVRIVAGRRTAKVSINDKCYYLKTHTGVGWREILKNLMYFRLPVLGAMNEWHGIHHLNRLGINTLTVAGYGTVRGNPAKRRSFILTDEIVDAVSLEEFCKNWRRKRPAKPQEIRFKRWLIRTVALIVRDIHNSGANHRDFYLCHFLLQSTNTANKLNPEGSKLYVIDLHRMQIRKKTPSRWAIKDVAGLYFSSKEIGLTTRDLFRFMKIYRACSLNETLHHDSLFWRRVIRRGENLYKSEKHRVHRSHYQDHAIRLVN